MSFIWPEYWPLLLSAPLLGLVFWALGRARRRRLAKVVGPRAPVLADVSHRRRRLKLGMFTAALLLALLAMLQPVWGEVTRSVEQRGVNIVVGLDVSRSMLARDVEPSRLERAQREIRALAEQPEGDRLGLVLFAGEASLDVPLTRDKRSFAARVAQAGPLSVARGGTDLGAALATALDALSGSTGEHEVIVLLTDGEDLEERGLRVAEQCRERGITVHCVGLGTARGGKIPVEGAFLKDRSGKEVVSTLDPATLTRIAEATGGDYSNSLLDLYQDRIRPMARKSFLAEERRAKNNRFQWPLFLAFVLWILDPCVGNRRR
jgi:Ca-activated chloride channel family protein